MKNRGFLNSYLHVLCCRLITRHNQMKSKPDLERRMIALIDERDLITNWKSYLEKWQNIEQKWSKICFFLKSLCSPVSKDLNRDIWQIIFELVVFYEIIISKAQTFSNFALEGGARFGSPFIYIGQIYVIPLTIIFIWRQMYHCNVYNSKFQ